jgi:hypothetical protein
VIFGYSLIFDVLRVELDGVILGVVEVYIVAVF